MIRIFVPVRGLTKIGLRFVLSTRPASSQIPLVGLVPTQKLREKDVRHFLLDLVLTLPFDRTSTS